MTKNDLYVTFQYISIHNESETSIKIFGSPWKSSMKSSHELYKHQELSRWVEKKHRHQGITAGLGGLLGMARTPQLEVGPGPGGMDFFGISGGW